MRRVRTSIEVSSDGDMDGARERPCGVVVGTNIGRADVAASTSPDEAVH